MRILNESQDFPKQKIFQGPLKNAIRESKKRRETPVLIVDKKVSSVLQFENEIVLWVRGGEKLKAVETFPQFVWKFHQAVLGVPQKSIRVFAVGGGSVTDFAGTLAGLYHRGIPLSHVPTTWLAAVDSAHGGKTGLNLRGRKNQLGLFYFADEIIFDRSLLKTQSKELALDAFAEVVKIALIQGGSLWRRVSQKSHLNPNELFELLPELVRAKMKIVAKDPFEESGFRAVLNLGHTIGHVLESAHGISHGQAVMQGLLFDLLVFGPQKLLHEKCFENRDWKAFVKQLARVRDPLKLLRVDKKNSLSGKLNYPVVIRPGKVVLHQIQPQKLAQLWQELSRQIGKKNHAI